MKSNVLRVGLDIGNFRHGLFPNVYGEQLLEVLLRVPGFKVGGSWRFRRDEIEKLTMAKSLGGKSNAS